MTIRGYDVQKNVLYYNVYNKTIFVPEFQYRDYGFLAPLELTGSTKSPYYNLDKILFINDWKYNKTSLLTKEIKSEYIKWKPVFAII